MSSHGLQHRGSHSAGPRWVMIHCGEFRDSSARLQGCLNPIGIPYIQHFYRGRGAIVLTFLHTTDPFEANSPSSKIACPIYTCGANRISFQRLATYPSIEICWITDIHAPDLDRAEGWGSPDMWRGFYGEDSGELKHVFFACAEPFQRPLATGMSIHLPA